MRERNFTLEPSYGSAEKSLKEPLQSRLRASSGGCLWGDLLHFADIGVTFRSTRRDGVIPRDDVCLSGVCLAPRKAQTLWALSRRCFVQIATDGASWLRMLLRRSSENNTPQREEMLN